MVCRIARIEQKTQEEEYNLESVDHATKSRPAEIQPTSLCQVKKRIGAVMKCFF